MRSRVFVPVNSSVLLAACIGFALPDLMSLRTAFAEPPSELKLIGVIRDFSAGHPDFNVIPGAGNGHYARNVDLTLGADGRPVFTGSGYQVASQWTDADGRPIPPHLYNTFAAPCGIGVPGIAVDGWFSMKNQSEIDGYDSTLGPYGGANVGDAVITLNNPLELNDRLNVQNNSTFYGSVLVGVGPAQTADDVVDVSPNSDIFGTVGVLPEPIPMPVVTDPVGLPWVGPAIYDDGGTYTINSDMHCDVFEISGGTTVQIDGNVTILAEGVVDIVGGGSLQVLPGSTLDFHLKKRMVISTPGNGNPLDPSSFRIYSSVMTQVKSNTGELFAQVFDGLLNIANSAEFYGTYVGGWLDLDQNAKFHLDMSLVGVGGSPGDSAGAAGSADNGGITDSVTFSEWFRDVLGENLSTAHTITLTRDVSGVYEYLEDAFYPIDDRLLGNAGEPRNNYFTYTIKAEFTYQSCAGQFVEFTGADDLWLFINGELAMDAGGVVPMVAQYLDLDRLGLADGATHRLELFYAHRQPISSVFRLRTDLVLSSTAPTTISYSYAGD